MKAVEYWVCALTSGEPECWDGPHRTAAAAHASLKKSFDTPKFAVYRVTCEKEPVTRGTVLNRPTPRPKTKPKMATKKVTTKRVQ